MTGVQTCALPICCQSPVVKKGAADQCCIVAPSLLETLLAERTVIVKENQILSVKIASVVAENQKLKRQKTGSALKKMNSKLAEEVQRLTLKEEDLIKKHEKEERKDHLNYKMYKQKAERGQGDIADLKISSVDQSTQTEAMKK